MTDGAQGIALSLTAGGYSKRSKIPKGKNEKEKEAIRERLLPMTHSPEFGNRSMMHRLQRCLLLLVARRPTI